MKTYLRLFTQIISIVCIGIFFIILKLWITNDPIINESKSFIIWGISIIVGVAIALFMKKNKVSNVLSKITLTVTVLSILLLMLTGFIYSIVASMP